MHFMLTCNPVPEWVTRIRQARIHSWNSRLTKLMLIMKMIGVLLIISLMHVYAGGNAQTVTFSGKNIPMKTLFDKIERQTGYEFIWDKDVIVDASPVTVDFKNTPLKEALNICFQGQPLRYTFIDNVIAVTWRSEIPEIANPVALITGRVLSGDSRQPLEGANVMVKGSTVGTSTDAQGNFSIKADQGQTLVISSVGYIQQEIKVGTGTNYIVQLKVAVEGLDQAIVIGYGTQSKRNVTGSIARVGEMKPEENITSNVFNALQGKVAGLHVKSTGGSPGSAPTFSIRGAQTTNSLGLNPLIVIDGLVIDGGAGFSQSNNTNFNLGNINPQDIESFEVLKDASSSAIYGARGAQGVIMITTKKGKLGKPTLTLNSYYGITKSTLGFRSLNNHDYQDVFKEARQNRVDDINKLIGAGGLTPQRIEMLNDEKDVLENEINTFKLGTPAGLFDNDWVNKVLAHDAATRNIQASVSGGTANNTYYFSFGKYSEDNSIGRGRYNRYSGKLALTQRLNDWFKIGGDFNVSLTESKDLNSPLIDAIGVRPDTPDSMIINEDGTSGYWFGLQGHPYASYYGLNQNSRVWNYMANVFGEITLRPGLTFKSSLAGVNSQSTEITFYSPLSLYGSSTGGQHGNSSGSGLQFTFNNTLNYKLSAGELRGDLLLGQEYFQNKFTSTGFAIQGFPASEGLWQPGNGSGYSNYEMSRNRSYSETGESYFFRSNLSWKNKYLLNASLRQDGTSKLTGKNQHSWFPAVSAGWIISDEDFFPNTPLISFLKIKSGVGFTGNIRTLGYFDYANLATTTTYLGGPALALSTVRGNPELSWEKTRQVDLGIEAKFFDNRLSLTLELYEKKTEGLITTLALPYSSGGFTSQKGNLGTVLNRGIDVDLSYRSPKKSEHSVSWNAGVVFNVNRNKILYLRDSILGFGLFVPGGPRAYVKMGQSVGSLQLYRSLGVDPNTGDMIYEDKNKDGIINQLDQEYLPVAQPKINGGFNLGAEWRQFSVSAGLSFSLGSKIYNLDDQFARTFSKDYDDEMSNKPEWVNERWRKPGDNSYYPRAIVGPHGAGQTEEWNTYPSTQYLFNASYLRFRNLTVGYQVPQNLLKGIGVPGVRFYASFQNVFVIKDKRLKLADPEVSLETSIQRTFTPTPRTVAFGIDVTL